MISDANSSFIEVLKQQEKLSETDLHKVKRMRKSAMNDTIPQLLIKLGICSESAVAKSFAQVTGLAQVSSEHYPLKNPLPETISLRFLKNYHIIGLHSDSDKVQLAVVDPEDTEPIQALNLVIPQPIELKIGLLSEIDAALDIQFGNELSQMDKLVDQLDFDEVGAEDLEHLKDLASEAPVIKLVNLFFQKAIEMQASDIHIEPFEQSLNIRLRVDGVLQAIDAPPVSSTAAVLSRIKIMAKLNIAERRLPQDGRIKLQMLGKELDLRVSTIPTLYGESVVIRLLDKENTELNFSALGFSGQNAQKFIEILAQPHGIILITGPTGSGKSTTLYTALQRINTPERKIITVEDPVEYQLDGINQIQAKPQIGLTFASALRSIVRQDPDVIMIGEMRDLETAKIAVQSALTGHLVLSTLHTNDAAGGITRLLDMGLEEYLLSSTVNGILAQRLVRKLCNHCKSADFVSAAVIEEMNLTRFTDRRPIQLYHAVGCSNCGGIGYQGRQAIMEFLPISNEIRKLIMTHQEAGVIQQQAIQMGMYTMYEDGLLKALAGITSLEEVLRVTMES